MPTRDELLARVAEARRRRNEAVRELDDANKALGTFEAAERPKELEAELAAAKAVR